MATDDDKARETGSATTYWAETAKSWAAVAVAFFAVLALAGFLFLQHRHRRAVEIDAELAQDAARLGREVELKYRNYRLVVDNVTRMMTSAGAAADERAGDYLNRLRNLVLPSQTTQLDQCEGSLDVESVKLCVARQMALLNDVQGLDVVKCPTASSIPSLSGDGRYLLIPPSRERPEDTRAGKGGEPPACGRVKIRRFLAEADDAPKGPAASAAEVVFEAVLLLRQDGTTLYSMDGTSDLRIAALPGFDAKRADASHMLSNLELGTTQYRAFLQPVRLRLTAPDKEARSAAASGDSREHADLIVCGLVREDRLAKASYAISLPSYLWVVLLLGLGLLSLPLAKLWLLGPKTAFRSTDVTVLATSALLFSLLGVVLVLAFVAHNRLDKRADRQVTEVGVQIAQRISEQIRASAGMLSEFDGAPDTRQVRRVLLDPEEGKGTEAQRVACKEAGEGKGTDAQRVACKEAGGDLVDGIVFNDDAEGRSVCERTQFKLGAHSNDWKLIFLMDRDGNERVKFVPGGKDSTAVSLRARAYFKRAMRQDTACLDPQETGEMSGAQGASDPTGCRIRGVPQLVRSVTSGGIVLVVAQPLCAASTCSEGEIPLGVSAIETEMAAFRALVLPLGVQAAVIDQSGQVMLHSNNDAHHEQDFFGEVDSPNELRAALAAKVPDTIVLNYLGQPSRVHIEPLRLPGTGWSVLTIAPASIVDVATTDMVLATLFGYGALLAGTVLLTCLVLLARRLFTWMQGRDLSSQAHDHDRGLSLRPHAVHSRDYAKLGLWAIRSGSILCVVAVVTTRWFPTTLGLLAAAVVCGFAVKRFPRLCVVRRADRRSSRSSYPASFTEGTWQDFLPLTYLLCIAGLSEVFVAAPATVFFAGAYDHVVDNLVRAEHEHYTSVLRHRASCLQRLPKADSSRDLPPSSDCNDVIGSGEERPAPEKDGRWTFLRSGVLFPLPYLADYLPPVGPADGEDSGRLYRSETIGQRAPMPGEYVSIREPTEMRLQSTLDGRTLAMTPLPALLGIEYHWPSFILLVLVAAAGMASAYFVGFRSLRRLFFLDALQGRDRPSHFDVSDLEGGPRPLPLNAPGRKLLVLFPTPAVRGALSASAHRDLRLEAVTDQPNGDDSPQTLWIFDLDSCAEDVMNAQRLLQVSRWSGTVVILAAIDPLERIPKEHQKAWAAAIERFETIELTAGTASSALEQIGIPSPARIARLWFECGESERRALAQLAIGGYVTPHPANEAALKKLRARGLLDPDTLTIAHEEVAEFAREATSPAEQASWAQADRGTPWMALRVPLATGVAALLAAVTMSKPELGIASALVPTLAAGLPSVLKMLIQMITPKAA